MKILPVAASVVLMAGSAAAQALEVRFVESAPKDRFVIKNTNACELRDITIELDLTNTRGGLIFDTTADGPGVEVFQPFETRSGDVELMSSARVNDGDKTLTVKIGLLPMSEQASFTIDVDDTLTNSALGQIRVAGTEIENGVVLLSADVHGALNAAFDETGVAMIDGVRCAN